MSWDANGSPVEPEDSSPRVEKVLFPPRRMVGAYETLEAIRPALEEHRPDLLPRFDSIMQSVAFAPPEIHHVHIGRVGELFQDELPRPFQPDSPAWVTKLAEDFHKGVEVSP